MLGVNKNTVFRAMRILRDQGLVEFRGGAAASRSPALLSRVRFKQAWIVHLGFLTPGIPWMG